MLVKPARSNVSPFCTRLTTITADMLIDAPPFAEVCDQLRNRYHSAARAWASWGAYDRKMFEAQCASFGVPYPFSEQHINLKQWYADLELDGKRVGMAAALRREQLMLDGTHHRGGDDAHNIARIVASVLARRGRGCLAV
jgi:inhibitor of KinA sporulation pathway (predicted exonuclease)